MSAAAVHIPIIRMDGFLVVSMQDDLTDRDVLALQERLTERIATSSARGVLIDVSAVSIVDSFTGRVLADLASVSHLLDAKTVVVGIQPAVAMTLVELGLELTGVETALDVDDGLARLREAERRR